MTIAIVDRRALAGGLSVLTVGIYLSTLLGFYFLPGGQGFKLLQARWFWELTFYLQIFCYVLMWLSHARRITRANGWRRRRAIWRLLVGLMGVSLPAVSIGICIANDWFIAPPPQKAFVFFGSIYFICWLVIDYLLPLLYGYLRKDRRIVYLSPNRRGVGAELVSVSPLMLLVLIAVFELMGGGYMHIVLWPFLTFLHRAISYFYAAFDAERHDARQVLFE